MNIHEHDEKNQENKPLMRLVSAPEFPQPMQRPYWACYQSQTGQFEAGVWFHTTRKTKEGETFDVNTRVCDPLEVVAITRADDGSGFGRLLKFKNSDGKQIDWAMPAVLLAGRPDDLLKHLLDVGFRVEYTQRAQVPAYINWCNPTRRMLAAHRVGWHGLDYVTPAGAIGEGAESVIYQGEIGAHGFSSGGTLGGWQNGIGKLLTGNPLLMLAVGTGLAGPLLHFIDLSGGGFHIVGQSSTGKTTLAEVLASVWGKPSEFMLKWNSTAKGLESVAASRNDSALVLDEIGIADPYDVSRVVYSVTDGVGRQRARQDGGSARRQTWRTMLFSTGEITLETKMGETGQRTQAGQVVRLINLDANRKHGALDTLHHHTNGGDLSKELHHCAAKNYGYLGPEFVRRLIEGNETDAIADGFKTALRYFNAPNGQPERVAQRFAVVAVALEFAAAFELLPLAEGEATDAMASLFSAWLAGNGTGPSENQKILTAIADFIDRHEARFQRIECLDPVRDRAGYIENDSGQTLYLFNKSGLEEATKGYEFKQVQQVLRESGAVEKHDENRLTLRKRLAGGGRVAVYAINPAKLK